MPPHGGQWYRLSSQWMSSHPTHRVELNAVEFSETFTTYMYMCMHMRMWGVRAVSCGRMSPEWGGSGER